LWWLVLNVLLFGAIGVGLGAAWRWYVGERALSSTQPIGSASAEVPPAPQSVVPASASQAPSASAPTASSSPAPSSSERPPAAPSPSAATGFTERRAIQTDDVPLGAEVPAGYGLVEVLAPAAAHIRIDGVLAGAGPVVSSVAAPGYHEVRVERGDRESKQVIEVRAGKVTRVSSPRP
jgi:hypothetical protein